MNRLFFLFVSVLFLVPADNLWARPVPFAGGQLTNAQIYQKTMGTPRLRAIREAGGSFEKYIATRGLSSIAGKAFEARTAIQVNRFLAKTGSNFKIRITALEGLPHSPADLELVHKVSGEVLEKFQLKLSGNEAMKALNNAKYEGMKIGVPSDQMKWIKDGLRKEILKAQSSGKNLSPHWAMIQDAIKSGRLTDEIAGSKMPTATQAMADGLKQTKKAFIAELNKITPTKTAATVARSAKYAKFVKFVKIGGGVLSIAGGAFDMGYGGYTYYITHQRYLAGELDWDIATGKKILAVGHVILGSGGVAVGVLLLAAPEAVITKVAGAVLVIAGVTYIIVDMVLDNYLEKLQAKRTMQRQELLATISWQERQKVCIEQLRKMI